MHDKVLTGSILSLVLSLPWACTKTSRPFDINHYEAGVLASPERGTPSGAPDDTAFVETCNIEWLNGPARYGNPVALRRGEGLHLEGWVVDRSNPKNGAEQVFIFLQTPTAQSRWHAAITNRIPRADVAKLKNSTLWSGFRASLDTTPLPLGEYLVLVAFWQEAPLQVCDVGRRILLE